MKLTPLEMAIRDKTDRRAKYEKKLRDRGARKVTVWTTEPNARYLQAIGRALIDADEDSRAAIAGPLSDAFAIASQVLEDRDTS